jgi:probable HAF family extracellular repeat protein
MLMKTSATVRNIMLTVAAVAAFGTSSSVQATEYSVTYLGNLSPVWQESYGWAINASGQVIGQSQVSGPDEQAFIWNSGSGIQSLGSLGGFRSDAYGINSSGTVVGASFIPNRSSEEAFSWNPVNGIQNLGWGANSDATGINNSGEIVGVVATGGSSSNSIVNGTSIGPGEANAVNNVGQVVGVTSLTSSEQAYIWDPVNHFHDVGFLPGATTSDATAINDAGQVVGYSGSNAFIWDSVHGM